MFGSKNSELTRKYSSTWLEAITFGFSSRWRVWNSQKPTPAKTSASSDERAAAPRPAPRRPRQPAQQREEQRERHVEEHDLLERLGRVVGVDALQRVEHDPAEQHPLQRPRALRRPLALPARAQPRHEPRHRARADHHVERHEQVRGRPARLHRHAERQRGQRGHAEHARAAREQPRQRAHARPARRTPRPAPARRGRARTPSAASSRSPPPAGPASAISAPSIAHARPRTVRAEHGAGGERGRDAPCPRSSTPSQKADVSLIASTGSGARRAAGCRRCCASPAPRCRQRAWKSTPAARRG